MTKNDTYHYLIPQTKSLYLAVSVNCSIIIIIINSVSTILASLMAINAIN